MSAAQKIWRVIIGVIAATILVLAAAVATDGYVNYRTAARMLAAFEQVRTGMTKAQVLNAMGTTPPPRESPAAAGGQNKGAFVIRYCAPVLLNSAWCEFVFDRNGILIEKRTE